MPWEHLESLLPQNIGVDGANTGHNSVILKELTSDFS